MNTLFLLWMATFAARAATQHANDVETAMRINRDAYLVGPHTVERRAAALAVYDQQWGYLKSSAACGSNLLGAAGRRCIEERMPDGKWPWDLWYRQPIAAQ